jgi:hypothetical protein
METDIREYNEQYAVFIDTTDGKVSIKASNQCGYDHTATDLGDVIFWTARNMPMFFVKSLLGINRG